MDTNVEIKEGHLSFKKTENFGKIYTRAVYIDDPLILDKESERNPLLSTAIEENNYFHINYCIININSL